MKGLVAGSKYLVSAGNNAQTVCPVVSGLSGSRHSKTTPPPSGCGTSPRCSRYHAFNASGSLALKKMPPIPVTRFIQAPNQLKAECLTQQMKPLLLSRMAGGVITSGSCPHRTLESRDEG